MAYKYEVYTLDKRIEQGTIEASSESIAEEILYRTGYRRVLKLREIRPVLTLERLLPSLFGIKAQEVIDFSRQLATLIDSGMSILNALQLLEKQTHRAALNRVITGLDEELRGGSPFSQALSKYPQTFPTTYCQVIKASEYSGNLSSALRQVASYMEKDTATVKNVKRAMAYPSLVLLMAIGVFILVTTVAMPPLIRLFTSLGAELPWMTKLLIAGAGFLTNYNFLLLGGLATVFILIIVYARLPAGKLAIDRLTLKIPVIGRINIERNMCKFCRTMSMLVRAGLPLPQIMNMVIGTASNRIIRQALAEVRQGLIQGQGLSQPMARIKLFPQLLVEMMVVGEKTGTLDTTLDTLSDFYEQRVDQGVRTLTSMIEPILIVMVALVVGFIAISMISPLYSILKSMY